MALTYRDTKGSPLTSAEADANIRQLAAGGIDYANPVVVNAASTLLVNRSHRILGSGYPLALPDPASNIGNRIFVRVALSTTGLFPITAANLALYAGESAEILATIDGWQRTSGELLPMLARIETTLAQQNAVPTSGVFRIPLSVTVGTPSLPAMVDLPSSSLVVQRAGRYDVNTFAAIKSAVVAGSYVLFVQVNSTGGANTYPVQDSMAADRIGLSFLAQSFKSAFAAGDRITLFMYNEDNCSLRGGSAGSQCSLTLTETV